MKTILFLGGMGFIGKNLVEAFLQSGEYRCLVFNSGNFIPEPSLLFKQVPIFVGNACTGDDLAKVLADQQVDILCHLISSTVPSTSNQKMAFDIESNLVGTVRILDLAVKHGVKKVVFLSSGGTVYGIPRFNPVPETAPIQPICSHGIVKAAVEQYLNLYHHLHGLEYLVCRVSNPYGAYHYSPIQGIINVVLRKILNGEQIVIWGDGKTVRDYIFAKDAADAILNLTSANVSNTTINIGSGEGTSINNVLNLLRDELGTFPVSYQAARSFDVPKIVLDITKLHSHISHMPTPLPEGLRTTIKWATLQSARAASAQKGQSPLSK